MPADTLPLFPAAGGGVKEVPGCGVVEEVVGCCTQLDSFVLPSVAEYLPLVQSTQTLAPSADEYLPLAHGKQSVAASLPSVARYLPATQSWQADAL
jgi:hypothetical protein